jgi:hypothetical protein
MGRTARRAAWLLAAMTCTAAVGAGAAWVANERDARGTTVARGVSVEADAPAETLRAERRDGAARSGPRRRERRHAEEEPETKPVTSSWGRSLRIPDVGGDRFLAEAKHRQALDEEARQQRRNLRSADPAPGSVRAARGWTSGKDALAPASGPRPDTTVARHPGAADDADDALDDAALDLAKTHGLRGDYFDLMEGEITSLPDAAKWPPTFSRIDLALDFDTDDSFALPFTPETFVVRWTGYLRVPEAGLYAFTCGSDDGARVVIGGVPVIVQPNLRAYGESSGGVNLTAGLHPIEVVFYENWGYASCRLWWDGPGWRRKIVATEFLTPPDEFKDVTPPVIASVSPASGFVGDVVTIRGAGFAVNAASMRVTFKNVPAEIVEAAADKVTVRVPVGAATGDVVVKTGVLSSLPRPFRVKNLLGLYGQYYQLAGELSDYPDFDHLAPYFVRLDGNLDFMDDNTWNLPYAPDVFAAQFSGFLYVPEDDDYRITLGSDDGAQLRLDGPAYLDLPGLHGYTEVSKTTRLAKGFHPIRVFFFENFGEARLALYWQRPGEETRSVIPEGFFYAPRELTDLPAPVIRSLAPAAAEIGSEIEIKGAGFGSAPEFGRVVFPGGVWVRPASVTDDRLRVHVPFGAASGELHVEVGVQSSGRVAFAVSSPQGLVADYFTFADEASLVAAASPENLAGLTPNFTRVESGWQRVTTKDWDLPFPASAFAVHWHGTLAVEYPTDVAWILRSAAGAWLDVDGVRANDCGPWHELEERYGDSRLSPGEHRFDLWFVSPPPGAAGAEPRLQLLYTPLGRLDHLPVPARWFLPRDPRPQ